MRKISEIIIHCTATPRGQHVTTEQIRECHVKQNGWNDIGYHYIIDLDGAVHKGRPDEVAGAHCLGHNSQSIGVAYVGGVEADGRPADTRTPEQKHSLRTLVGMLLRKYPESTVHGHNEFAAKACPSFNVAAEFGKKIIGVIAAIILSTVSTGCGTIKKATDTKTEQSETTIVSTLEKQILSDRLLEIADLSVSIDSAVIERHLTDSLPAERLKTGRITLKLTQRKAVDTKSAIESKKEYRRTAEAESKSKTEREIDNGSSIISRMAIIVMSLMAGGWLGWRFCRKNW